MNNSKELRRTLKSLDIPFKGGKQPKISLKENGLISYNSNDNANTFYKFFSNLTDSSPQKHPGPRQKLGIKITEEILIRNISRFETNVWILFYTL